MSTSYHAQLVLGGVVKPEEVYDEQPSVFTKCPACKDALAMSHKFCHDCGNQFISKVRRTWKDAVLGALQRKNQRWKPEWADPEFFEAPVFDLAGSIVLGEQLALVPAFSSRAVSIPSSQLDAARERVQAIFQEMQLSNREICLFPYVFAC